ncbi:unnamed protein product [Bathycoccus prasinos]
MFYYSEEEEKDGLLIQDVEKKKKKNSSTMTMMTTGFVLVLLFVTYATATTRTKMSATATLERPRKKATISKTSKEVKNKEDDQQQQRFNPLVIVQRDNEKDYQDLERIQKVFPKATSIFGVNTRQWPQNLEDAEYGLQPLRIFNRENFKSLTWKADDKRRNPDKLKGIQWIASIDGTQSKDWEVGRRTDANCASNRMHNFISLGAPGPNQEPFRDGYDRRMYFYYWPLDGPGASLSFYAIGPDFSYKAFNFISRKGADMIDGFLFGKLCRDDYVSEDAASPGNFLLPEIGSALVKPRAEETNTKDNKLKVLNCYLLGDVELVKKDADDKEATLRNDEYDNVENEKIDELVTIFKAKVHHETSKKASSDDEQQQQQQQKDIDVTIEKPTESSSQITIKTGDVFISQTISNNNDGTFSFEVNEKNVDGQEQGETKTEKITVDTTQMPGPYNELFSSVMNTMANGGGPFNLQQQQQ